MSGMLIQNLIDMDKWNAAKWTAVNYLNHLEGKEPPCLGLAFGNGEVGKQIFEEWINYLGGRVDAYDELRITIIEDALPSDRPGYFVRVSSSPWNTEKRAKASGMIIDADTAVVATRVNRMFPARDSTHLATFKQEFRNHGRYFLIPVSIIQGDSRPTYEPHLEYAIGKTEIYLTNSNDFAEPEPGSESLVNDYTDGTIH
jgi:hypothetical protein